MSQFSGKAARRAGGDVDVYTGLLFVATIVLAVGVYFLATTNMDHSASGPNTGDGGLFKIVQR